MCELLKERTKLLKNDVVDFAQKEYILKETEPGGEARLHLLLQNDCFIITGLDKKKISNISCDKCADHIIFEKSGNHWKLHIFELKRTVNRGKWLEMKKQFRGALLNALGYAGVLGLKVDLERTCIYSVYRNDKLLDKSNPAKVRYENMQRGREVEADSDKVEMSYEKKDWMKDRVSIEYIGFQEFKHIKVPLDQTEGDGEVEL